MATPPEHTVNLPGFKPSSQARDTVQPRETGVRMPTARPKTSPAKMSPLQTDSISRQSGKPHSYTSSKLPKSARQGSKAQGKSSSHLLPDTQGVSHASSAVKPNSRAAVGDLQGRRQEKQWQIQLRQLRSLAQLICFGVLVTVAWQWVSSLNLYTTPQIKVVTPTQLTPAAAIESVMTSLLPVSSPSLDWLTLNQAKAAEEISKKLPFVQRAVVQPRLFPSRIDVALQETAPWAVVYTRRPKDTFKRRSSDEPTTESLTEKALPKPEVTPKKAPVVMEWVVSGYLVAGETRFHSFTDLSTGARNQLLGFLAHPSNPYVKVLVPNAASAKKLRWAEIRELAQWLNELPEWQTAWLDSSNPESIVIRHNAGPDVLLGAFNHDWQQRFRRLGLLLPYWKGWQSTIQAIDLRWPSQISLVPVKGKTLPSDWETRLATPSDANAL